jgi:hypothetical protein
MVSRTYGASHPHVPRWAALVLTLVGCASADDETTPTLSSFDHDTWVLGVVRENVTACEVDATCYLRLEFGDTSVVALYGTGERPASGCDTPVEASDAAFQIRPGARVNVILGTCAEGLYVRRLDPRADPIGDAMGSADR